MNDHEQYRRALLADPSLTDPELTGHRNGCAQCRAYTDRVLGFEQRLARALNVPLTAGPIFCPSRAEPRRVPVALVGSLWPRACSFR